MNRIFLDDQRRLRNGWWILVFIAFVALTRVVHTPLLGLLKQLHVSEAWREPLPVVFLLLATWACMRLRRQSLSDAGLRPDARFAREFALGGAVGIASLLVVTALMMAAGVVQLQLDPARSVGGVMWGLYVFLWAALLEELLFRGFVFQRLVDGIGVRSALGGMAALFAIAHWSNPGMDGIGRIVASVDIALAAVMLGLAYVRTRSLALPLGLHLGWNWMQGSVLGFNVSGFDHAGWWAPVIDAGSPLLSGGGVGPEGSVFSVGIDLVLIALLWKWKGTAPRSADAFADTDVQPGTTAVAVAPGPVVAAGRNPA